MAQPSGPTGRDQGSDGVGRGLELPMLSLCVLPRVRVPTGVLGFAMIQEPFLSLGVALALGLLVGLQREQAGSTLGGIRTFALLGLLGSLTGLMADPLGPTVPVVGFLAVTALVVAAHFSRREPGDEPAAGQTTEVAALLMYGIGVYTVLGDRAVAVALGGTLAVLLYLKKPLHDFVHGLGARDTRAIFQFALLSLVILPVLPDRRFGPPPYDVFNPRSTWFLVVLIVGISLAGYVASKLLGLRAGAILGGVFGGLISSTATTASFARRSRDAAGPVGLPALVILIATAVSTARVAGLAALIAADQVRIMLPPLAAVLAVMVTLAAVVWLGVRGESAELPEQENPAELRPAMFFAAVYLLVLLGVSVAKAHFGDRGLYAVAAVSGLTDLDAITLSTAKLVQDATVEPTIGWRVILVGVIANLIFKTASVFALGSRPLAVRVLMLFGISAIAAGAVVAFWPG